MTSKQPIRNLSGVHTFFTKYIMTAAWLVGVVALPISNYNKFGQFELWTGIPFLAAAALSYLPKKIFYDETRVVISDWLNNKEYRFENIKSLEYSRFWISVHPYKKLIIKTNDDQVSKTYFIPRFADTSLFSSDPQGRQEELLELWNKCHAVNNSYLSVK